MGFSHIPVLLNECIESLNIKLDGVYVDATAGGAGHSFEIAKRLGPKGRLIAIDQDESAVKICKDRLKVFGDKVTVVRENFKEIDNILKSLNIDKIDGFLADLGVSSHQLDCGERGFSYNTDAPLDMRMDSRSELTAKIIVNEWSQNDIKKILFEYGEERYSALIAAKIVNERKRAYIDTTFQLSELIKSAMPSAARRENQHPAKRTFQALRIAVNDELGCLERLLGKIADLMNSKGRISLITFHSLEDRIVKTAFVNLSKECVCPKGLPVCICNTQPLVKSITKKPIQAGEAEIISNPRARSAKLRVAERI